MRKLFQIIRTDGVKSKEGSLYYFSASLKRYFPIREILKVEVIPDERTNSIRNEIHTSYRQNFIVDIRTDRGTARIHSDDICINDQNNIIPQLSPEEYWRLRTERYAYREGGYPFPGMENI
jgi:hypothetical protein